ncbi:MAG: hypothetical protein Q4G71_14135 [Pseudomonadota bacterium]|nr:hypothetical protein [Pseudomonadota bacterium]
MRTVEKIEHQIVQLSPAERADLRDWFLQRDAEDWDTQMAEDARMGKLDALAARALEQHAQGKTRPL